MKKRITWMVCAFALVLTGCLKEETASPRSDELYPVKFNISTFGKQIVPMAGLGKNIVTNASSKSSLSGVLNSLTYVVFDELGKEVSKKVSYSSDENFGMIADELPVGSYKVTFSGSDMGEIDISNTYRGWISLHQGGKADIFHKEIDLTVPEGGVLTQSVEMIRKVGQIEIVPLDKIPSRVYWIEYTVHKVSRTFYLKDHSGRNDSKVTTNIFYNTDADAGLFPDYTQPLFANFFLDRDLPAVASVSIQAYDKSRSTLVDKVIHDVPVSINKKTILTGYLFGNLAEQDFSVTFDDNWNSDIIDIKF